MRRLGLLAVAVISTACPPKNAPPAPVFSVSGPTALAWDIGPHPVRELHVHTQRDDQIQDDVWMWEQVADTDAARVRLLPETGEPVEFRGFPDGETRAASSPFTEHLLRDTLWITLPSRPVTLGESWDDPQWVEPFLALLPAGTAERVSGRSELVSVVRRDNQTEAVIDSMASVSLEGRIVIEAQARGVFRVNTGELLRRDVTARFYTPTGPDTLHIAVAQPGG